MRNMKLIYAEPEMDLIKLQQADVVTSSYGDYDGTGMDEEFDEINF